MQPVNLTCHTDHTQLVMQGTLDVSVARTAYDTLSEALTRALPLQMDAAELERVDAAGLQLLVVFVKIARERGLDLEWLAAGSALETGAELLGLRQTLELPQ